MGPHNILGLVFGFIGQNAWSPFWLYGGAKRRRGTTPKMSQFVSVCVVFLQHFPRKYFGFYRIRISYQPVLDGGSKRLMFSRQ